jgi:mannose/fructose/N-acetylgalactosamine-specific phosphotransferase system component IIC
VLYALSWSVTFILLALWSVAAWAFHSIAAWTVSNAGVLAGGTGTIESLRVPDWLAPWIPTELTLAFTSMLSALSPAIEATLNQAPALAGGLSVATWMVWGVGFALIVILGLVCSRLITVLRRRGSVFAAPSMGPVAAD